METKPVVNNAFDGVLRNQRRGAMLTEASEKLMQAVQAVREQGKAATLIIKLKVSPANVDGSALSVTDEVTLALPKQSRGNSLFYATEFNSLVLNNPNQSEMELTVTRAPEAMETSPVQAMAQGQ